MNSIVYFHHETALPHYVQSYKSEVGRYKIRLKHT